MRFNGLVQRIASPHRFAARNVRLNDALALGSETRSNLRGLPAEIAFLASYGVTPAQLSLASRLARRQGVSADRALIANGIIEETYFYRCLARHLGLSFVEEPVRLIHTGTAYSRLLKAGLVPFASLNGLAWLAAPRGHSILTLLRHARRNDRLEIAIATPSHLSKWVQQSAHRRIAAEASFELLSAKMDFCAHGGANLFQKLFAGLGLFVFAVSFAIPMLPAASIWLSAAGLMFLAAIVFRLSVSTAALHKTSQQSARLEDHELPDYTVLVALYQEADIVRRLIRMLDRIDYPRSKLDIKLILEEDDRATRLALEALPLDPVYEIIIAPPGEPRTKPRALNVALPLARGELIVVFDAEDAPGPLQLRRAAERFASAPSKLACLQAKLAIDNAGESWLTGFFAIEYAALFELQNIGLACLKLPFPVSGSSNHFRASVLRGIHGWDAWNVTEDADIGIRLARFGYDVDVLDATTYEEAPVSLEAWLGQRRRWFKGWLQTLITLTRRPRTLFTEIGIERSIGLALLLSGLLLGPLLWVPANIFMIVDMVRNGFQAPADWTDTALATLWTSVSLLGLGSLFWHAFMGMKRQRLLHLWPVLPLLPFYYCLHTVAAWTAVFELFQRPFHWQKTQHGLTRGMTRAPHMPILSRLAR